MVGAFRALAVDFDGTLTHDGRRPAARVLEALAEVRRDGCRVVLVTGRILSELRADFPDVDEHVDTIVAENGCVLSVDGSARLLAPRIDDTLAKSLDALDVPYRAGDAILACDGVHAMTVLEQVRALGLDCQLVRNREALMVLPAGVTKGTGLFEALGDLGVSRHSTVGVGDAENDHALVDVCELGVAVGNAVPALKRHADLVLSGDDGDGIIELVTGPVFAGEKVVHSRRWDMMLGTTPAGEPVTLPTSRLNLLVCGDTGLGKSYVAGLVAERLIALGYCCLVVDPEGDHRELGRLRGVVTVDAADGLPAPVRLASLMRQRFSSVVLDLSCLAPEERGAYLDLLTVEITAQRRDVGLPHWIVCDEAHIGEAEGIVSGQQGPDELRRGQLLVTYRPFDLADVVLDGLDGVLALADDGPLDDSIVSIACRVSGLDEARLRHLAGAAGAHRGLLALNPEIGPTQVVAFAARTTPQVRHAHKYGVVTVPAERRFYFRNGYDTVVDVVGSMAELCRAVARVDDEVLVHHATSNDLSRWIGSVFQDHALAGVVAEAEHALDRHRIPVSEERARILAAVVRRYPV